VNVRLSFFLIIIIIITTTTTTTTTTTIIIIISITKFLIMIGSPPAYLSRNWHAITWESNYRYPIGTFCNWIPVIGYHGIRSSITYASIASFAMLPKVFKTYEKRYRCVRSKELIKRHF